MHVEEALSPAPVAPPDSAPAAALPAPRLWPAVTLVSLWWAFSLISPTIELTTGVRFLSRIAVTALVALLFSVWWWTNRRIRLRDRTFLFLGVVLGGIVVAQFCDPSVGGWGLFFFGVPLVLTAWTAWMLLAKVVSGLVVRRGRFRSFR